MSPWLPLLSKRSIAPRGKKDKAVQRRVVGAERQWLFNRPTAIDHAVLPPSSVKQHWLTFHFIWFFLWATVCVCLFCTIITPDIDYHVCTVLCNDVLRAKENCVESHCLLKFPLRSTCITSAYILYTACFMIMPRLGQKECISSCGRRTRHKPWARRLDAVKMVCLASGSVNFNCGKHSYLHETVRVRTNLRSRKCFLKVRYRLNLV